MPVTAAVLAHRTIKFPSFLRRSSPPTMSTTTTTTTTVVEHVVLFKVRDTAEPSKAATMISNLRALAALPAVSHLSAAPILRLTPSTAGFTHVLHSRYASKPDLAAYAAHPDHQAVLKADILPICDDIMALDWVADFAAADAPPPPGAAVRVTLAKPKEGVAAAEAIGAIGRGSGDSEGRRVSFGENFSPARAKWFSVGFLEVFSGVEELEKAQEEKDHALLDSVMVVDFVVASS